ncbi:MAG: hypothetical protein G8345_06405 [Magnetococcales bacterium]|nr:hypothetical protein [Magnetococcales bacterium]NGZ26502.1 hypothetical protein [Magnetococcales bacterium]
MTIVSRLILKFRRSMNSFWDNDPLKKRPLAGLAVQEHRVRSKHFLHQLRMA